MESMHLAIEKLLTRRDLSQEAQDYLMREYYKHTIVLIVPAVLASIALVWFDYFSGELGWPVVGWLILLIIMNYIRYRMARQNLSSSNKPKPYFSLVDYVLSAWFIVYLLVSGWQSSSESEVIFKGFFIYTTIVFHLEILRFSLLRLSIHALIICIGIALYIILFTLLAFDTKVLLTTIVIFGFTMLIYFGRSSHNMALETYDLLSQNQKLILKMDNMLVIDYLTQHYNRRYFNMQLTKYLELFIANQQHFSVAIIDIDFFKKINDNYGHDIGDEALVCSANFIGEHIRNTDIFTRYGGEEFALILPLTDKKVSLSVLDKLRIKFEQHVFELSEYTIDINISIGIAEVEKSDSLGSIMKRADNALYKAKNDGRNRVVAL